MQSTAQHTLPAFWNTRYSDSEYCFGTTPNQFFAAWLSQFEPGTLVLPAEGEGRNAVFAAQLGWNVHAIDFSEQGHRKALELAEKKKVTIQYSVSDVLAFKAPVAVNAVAFIFFHPDADTRTQALRRFQAMLKPGGVFLLEGYRPLQTLNGTGGPREVSYCWQESELLTAFAGWELLHAASPIKELKEGTYHRGLSHTIEWVARKPLE